jgi:hypothetical protein
MKINRVLPANSLLQLQRAKAWGDLGAINSGLLVNAGCVLPVRLICVTARPRQVCLSQEPGLLKDDLRD